jgi:hypothetical protein
MDLELFLQGVVPAPVQEDIGIFQNIISVIDSAPSNETAATLQRLFAKVLRSNKAERDVIVAILGFCGVLETRDHPGFLDRFIPVGSRVLPGRRFVDMPYPACWWTRDAGMNRDAIHEFFGHIL